MGRLLTVLLWVVVVSGLVICGCTVIGGCAKKDKGGAAEPNQVAALN
jgi:hypothetical protein